MNDVVISHSSGRYTNAWQYQRRQNPGLIDYGSNAGAVSGRNFRDLHHLRDELSKRSNSLQQSPNEQYHALIEGC